MRCQNCSMDIPDTALVCPYCRLAVDYSVYEMRKEWDRMGRTIKYIVIYFAVFIPTALIIIALYNKFNP